MSIPNIPFDFLVNGEPLRALATVSIDPVTGEPVAVLSAEDLAPLATAAKQDELISAVALTSTERIRAMNGEVFNADGPATYARTPEGNIAYVEIADDGAVYRQTWTWTDGFLTGVSGWERQA